MAILQAFLEVEKFWVCGGLPCLNGSYAPDCTFLTWILICLFQNHGDNIYNMSGLIAVSVVVIVQDRIFTNLYSSDNSFM